MSAQQLNIDVISNNLANVSTTGFKKSSAEFQDLLYETILVPGSPTSPETESPTGISVGVGVRPASVAKIYSQGELQQTEDDFNVAIEGRGFFQIETPDGNTAYSRVGILQRDSTGQLTNSTGFPILPSITIPEGSNDVAISTTGIVSAILAGDTTSTELGTIELANFINPSGLRPIGGNLLGETSASGTPTIDVPSADGFGSLLQGFIEGSNVNIVQELTNLISAQRAFELNSKTIETSDEMMQTVNNIV